LQVVLLLQTFGFQNCTLVGFHTFLICIPIFFKIKIHVLLHSFLIHLPLQTLSHHPIHIVLQILNFLCFLVYFQLKSLYPLPLRPPSFVFQEN
jgi:hypothetical protein